ncbi:hypothetical protein F2P56_019713 [Juglans regia]|uniref:Uncharacterized mitochondrial protein AtMg00860-like n=2 Tax=Juglans regia TaxID=51240 RepID=A0A2I4EJI6_JUGRE|nr:uncharacterized mitochondrial protein AtMg00860-like [Juglans regia]KAF5459795.1 hypothetical protein F2P56_019713 [Juglans regia]
MFKTLGEIASISLKAIVAVPSPKTMRVVGQLRKRRETLQQHQLYAKQSKCKLACGEIEYLGHLISKDRVRVDPKKLESMIRWLILKETEVIKGFLGLIGYYRKFIKGYGQVAAHLTTLLKKDAFLWNEGATQSFNQLKAIVTNPLVLSLPDFSKVFVIECDVCGTGISVVLMQE